MTLLAMPLDAPGLVGDDARRVRPSGRDDRRRPIIPVLLFTALLALVPACAAVGPVDVDTKTDVCARCRMSIDTLAHAAEIVTADGDIRKYDSLGCLLEDYREMTKTGRRLAGVWVIDYDTKGWLKAESAYYALVNLPTDHMGFGAAATSARGAASRIAGGDAAKVIDWRGLLSHAGRPSVGSGLQAGTQGR